MDNIKDVIKDVIKNLSENKPADNDKVFQIWNNVLNGTELEHSKLSGLKNNKLFINVDSPTWLFHFRGNSKKILKRVQEELPYINNISFRIGKIK